MQADMLTQIILPMALFIIMLGMGLALRVTDFIRVFKAPKAIACGLLSQLIVLPLLSCLVIALCQLKGELAVGLMIIALCPGGTTSNMISYLARGDVALSMSLTALVSLITPFTMPFATAYSIRYFMGDAQSFTLPLGQTILQLIIITIIPVVIGLCVHHQKPSWAAKLEKPIKKASIVFLIVIIAGIVLKNKNNMINFFIEAGFATLIFNILAIAAGYCLAVLSRLSHAQAVTLGIEVGIQNGTVALLIASTILENPLMSIPAVTYSLLMFVTGGIFGWLINTVWPRRRTD